MLREHTTEFKSTRPARTAGHELGGKLITELTPAPAVRNSNKSAMRLALPIFFVVAFAIALFALPGTASAFNVANFNYANSSAPGSSLPGTQAASHPNVTVSFNRQGSDSEDLKNVELTLPTGVFPNPEAATTKCTSAQFNADACPSASNVGTVTVVAKAMGLLDLTIHGTVDVLTPDSNAVSTLGITLRPDKLCLLIFCAVPEKQFLKTNATINTFTDHSIQTITAGSPNTSTIGIPLIVWTPTISADITVNSMALSFQSRAGDWGSHQECSGPWWWRTCKTVADPPTGPYFMTQTTSCDTATAKVRLTSYQNVTSSATSSFTPTGCPSVPFDPQLTFTPANTSSNTATNVSFVQTQPEADAPIQQSFPKFVDADLPDGSGLDLNALSGVANCSEDELQRKNGTDCPASSEIGDAYAFSKFMPGATPSTPGLVGKVYAMSVTSQIDMAVRLDGPRGAVIVLRGTMGARNGHVYSTFDRVPQVPFREFGLTMTKAAYKNPAACGTATSNVSILGYSGASAAHTTSYTVDNCAVPPVTSLDGKPTDPTDDPTASFTFSSDQPGSTFQCSLDNGPWTPCTSPWTSQALAVGDHNFRVKALKGVVEDLTPESWDFEVVPSSYTVTPDYINVVPTDAVDHPDVDGQFTIGGTGTPKDFSLKMPRGFAASLGAVDLCPWDDGVAGTCGTTTPTSKIGTVELRIKDSDDVVQDGTGDLYLTDRDTDALPGSPEANDAGGIAVKLTGFSAHPSDSLIVTGGAHLVENGAHQYLELRNIPNSIGGDGFQAQQLKIHLDGNENGDKFLTNPSNCDPSSWEASSVNHSNVQANAFSYPFQATDCESVPFGPELEQILANPTAGQTTGVSAHLTMPTDNSAIQTLQVDEPRVIKPNFPAFGDPADQCQGAAITDDGLFDPTPCPTQAKVGTMTLHTPLLPNPLEGEVYLVEASPIPWLGVAFDSPGIHVTMLGITSTPKVNPSCNPLITPGGCPTRISIIFDGVPDVQISSLDMDLTGPARTGVNGPLPGEILALASPSDPGCKQTSIASSTIWGYSDPGNPLLQDQEIHIPTCNNP